MAVFTDEESGSAYLSWGFYHEESATRPITLEDILACCLANAAANTQILNFLRQQGFRREKITRQELKNQGQSILNELRDMKKEIRRKDAGRDR